jgi:hypothetical protein
MVCNWTWRMVYNWTWSVLATHVPSISTWKIGEFRYGFQGFFKGKEAYSKTKAFGEHKHTDLTVKRVIFRYFCPLGSHALIQLHCDAHCLHFFSRYFTRELQPLSAIEKAALPLYLSIWLLKTSPHCMYTVALLCGWSVIHLKAGCWYLDYGKTFCPEDEEDVKKTSEPLGESSSPPGLDLLTETPPPNPRKRDANFAGLSISRPSLKNPSVGTVQVDEFFYNGSLQTLNAYFTEHEAFSKEWMDLQAFLRKVHPL